MLPLRWARQRVAFLPGDTVEKLTRIPGKGELEVILSNHLVRYAVLPWSEALSSEGRWASFAEHVFAKTYGPAASDWRIRICNTGRRRARVACAVEGALLDALAGVERVVSVVPHFMVAFNGRRSEFARDPGWIVVHEPGRLTLGLVCDGEWKLLRNRSAREEWRDTLGELLRREAATSGEPTCERVVISLGEALHEHAAA